MTLTKDRKITNGTWLNFKPEWIERAMRAWLSFKLPSAALPADSAKAWLEKRLCRDQKAKAAQTSKPASAATYGD